MMPTDAWIAATVLARDRRGQPTRHHHNSTIKKANSAKSAVGYGDGKQKARGSDEGDG